MKKSKPIIEDSGYIWGTLSSVIAFKQAPNENPGKERMSKDRWIIYLIGVGVLLHSNGYKVEL